ncbi:MAG TPA: prepilin-type N-terminal cleavage/methylation domain-containing protein [Phycisphaerae bacterium]|nr:prepilin-type N-terminal cleavage/methylation domain-containing protein [Phycisphaerae bacterium]
MKRLAYTLVEVLIVVIVLGILAAIVVPQFSNASEESNLSSLKTNLQIIRGQLQLYKIQHNETWPSADKFVDQMTKNTKIDGSIGLAADGFHLGPYLQTIPNNPYTGTNTVGQGAVGTSAWYYDETTGEFKANDSAEHAIY